MDEFFWSGLGQLGLPIRLIEVSTCRGFSFFCLASGLASSLYQFSLASVVVG